MSFASVEYYRALLRQRDFAPLDDAALATLRDADEDSAASLAIEGMHPTSEQAAFHAMLIEERVPVALGGEITRQWVNDRIAAAQTKTARG